jgi:hypothetical protein
VNHCFSGGRVIAAGKGELMGLDLRVANFCEDTLCSTSADPMIGIIARTGRLSTYCCNPIGLL